MPINLKMLDKMPDIFANIKGLRAYLLTAILGAVASFSMPPYSALFMLIFAGVIFLWQLISVKTKWQAGMLGFCFGFGMFAIGLSWVNNAIIIYAPTLSFFVPLVCLGFGIFGGLFFAISALIASLFKPNKLAVVLSFAAIFTLSEWVRSWIFTGFPWNLTAMVWDKSDNVMQSLSLFGAYGLGLFTWIVIGLLAIIFISRQKKRIIFIIATLLLSIYSYGFIRLDTAENAFRDGVILRLVQPNVKSTLSRDEAKANRNFNDLIQLSYDGAKEQGVTHIIWGETASPFPIYEGSPALNHIMAGINLPVTFISGTFRRDKDSIYNSAVVIDKFGKVLATYDKSHLVPFGEYVPFRGILPLEKFTPGFGDFTAGKSPASLGVPNAGKAGVLICYEVIFPAEVKDKNNYPDWFINLTYDGWYGNSAGPYQHLATAKMRAIEEGIPLVRVASTGISAVIDGYGRIIASLPLDTRGVLDSKLPLPITGGTPYGNMGNLIPILMTVILLLSVITLWIRAKS